MPPPSAYPGSDPCATPRLLATVGASNLSSHLKYWGPPPRAWPGLIDEVDHSRLVGRGGAGFPTARKLAAVGSRAGAFVVANGTEGEPLSSKDKALLVHAPHLVLDGVDVASDMVGASESIICVDHQATAALASVRHAVAERIAADIGAAPVRVEATPSGYLAGEETALIAWLNGKPLKPTFGPRPFERGVKSRPSLVNNVETLAHLALIARFGSAWFHGLGTETQPGTALLTIAGDVRHPAVYEVALGTPLADALRPAGPAGQLYAALVGGYAGTWLPASAVPSVCLDGQSLRRFGAGLGCGSIAVVTDRSCGLNRTAQIARWLAEQSAGQCGPCLNGLPAIAHALDRLAAGHDSRSWKHQLERWLTMVDGRGACKHPDGAVRMVRSALAVFAQEIEWHASAGPCDR
jgi:NADH:ubiquinone oxidoreductase subunit F (NADH-binding)